MFILCLPCSGKACMDLYAFRAEFLPFRSIQIFGLIILCCGGLSCALQEVWLREFTNLNTVFPNVNFRQQQIASVYVHPMQYKQHPWPPSFGQQQHRHYPTPSCDNQKYHQTLSNVPRDAKLPLFKNHRVKVTHQKATNLNLFTLAPRKSLRLIKYQQKNQSHETFLSMSYLSNHFENIIQSAF